MQEGQYTKTIYTLIKNHQYADAVAHLEPIRQVLPQNRAVLSLLGYCYYYQGHYESACQIYEALVRHFPGSPEYRMHQAQALHKAGDAEEATRIIDAMKDFPDRTTQLKLAIAYGADQVQECRRILKLCPPGEPETLLNEGCILYKEAHYKKARDKFKAAMEAMGKKPSILYSIALCYYKQHQPGQALKYLAQVIEKGVREQPQLSVGAGSAGDEVRSVGNCQVLQDTALVEAFNLKAAIEFQLANLPAARAALTDMPPRAIEELDPVSLHNRALVHMDDDPEETFNTLNFLIGQPPFPPETFANLLLLYIKPPHNFHDLAADTLAEHPDYVQRYLSRDLLTFLDAANMKANSPEESYSQFEVLAKQHIDRMRVLTKMIQDARGQSDSTVLQSRIQEYDEELEKYIPVLMAQAHIYWEMGHYSQVVRVLNQSRDFAGEHDTWKLNFAHTHFMMDAPGGKDGEGALDNYQKAIEFYEPIVLRGKEKRKLLDLTAMVVANLCVSYIMTSQNMQAEEIMKQLEQEEVKALEESSTKSVIHLCIVNLVIGTLYCAKANYEFGIGRVMKALEPLDRKLETDTWYYAKRCFLALVDGLAKHMITLNDKIFEDVLLFLDKVHAAGKEIPASFNPMEKSSRTVATEARMLKRTLLKIRDC